MQRVSNQTQIFMYSSVMNAVIKLLLSQGNKISCLRGGGGEGLPEKVNTDALAQVLGFSGLNFRLGIRLPWRYLSPHIRY